MGWRTWVTATRRLEVGAGCLVAFLSSALSWSGDARADDAHVVNRCPRLSPVVYDELDARVLLLLKGETVSLPAIVCTDEAAWVDWRGERFDITGRSIPDEVVEVLAAQLRDDMTQARPARAPAERTPAKPPQRPLDAPLTELERPFRKPRPATSSHGGGMALGMETELPTGTVSATAGPVIDFAKSSGPALFGGRLAFRFSMSGRQVSFMDLAATFGFGAPFNPEEHFGVVLGLGGEAMVASPVGGTAETALAPVSFIGMRVAHSFGLVGLWLGVDGRARLTSLELRLQRELVQASSFSGSLLLGLDIVDWSRDRR